MAWRVTSTASSRTSSCLYYRALRAVWSLWIFTHLGACAIAITSWLGAIWATWFVLSFDDRTTILLSRTIWEVLNLSTSYMVYLFLALKEFTSFYEVGIGAMWALICMFHLRGIFLDINGLRIEELISMYRLAALREQICHAPLQDVLGILIETLIVQLCRLYE